MHCKLLACDVLQREVWHSAARSPHTFDIEFTPKDAHNHCDQLRADLQHKIDLADAGNTNYDAVLLAYGLCGNATAGLQARSVPLVLPRAHDCCTLFLGSRKLFEQYFKDQPSTPFSSAGYMEKGGTLQHDLPPTLFGLDKAYKEYIATYGEDNARYIWRTLQSSIQHQKADKLVFIDVPEVSHLGYAEKARRQAEALGLLYLQLPGSMALIDGLLYGDWLADEYLVVPPGQKIKAVYDWDEIVRVE